MWKVQVEKQKQYLKDSLNHQLKLCGIIVGVWEIAAMTERPTTPLQETQWLFLSENFRLPMNLQSHRWKQHQAVQERKGESENSLPRFLSMERTVGAALTLTVKPTLLLILSPLKWKKPWY